MAKVVGDIAIAVGADVTALQKGMAKGAKSVKGFKGDAADMAKSFAKNGAKVAAAAAAVGASLAVMASKAASNAKEIKNLSTVAGASAEEFQKWSIAADTVGISQEKLSDILKDVNDRVGDFLETGGGPMKDFFENIAPKIGVTADQFANLSGPQSLAALC